MKMFENDEIIMERPKCQMPGCNNSVLALIGNKWVCGKCAVLLNDRMNKMIFEGLNDEN